MTDSYYNNPDFLKKDKHVKVQSKTPLTDAAAYYVTSEEGPTGDITAEVVPAELARSMENPPATSFIKMYLKDYPAKKLVGTRWQRTDLMLPESHPYNGYTVIMITNLSHEHPDHPPQVIYKGDNGKEWSLDLSRWPGNLEPETEDNFKKVPVVIDLDESAWLQIKEAVAKSTWIPEEYCMNEWLADVCYFLECGDKPMIEDCRSEQTISRIYRKNQSPVEIHIIKKDSVDQVVINTLKNK